MKDSSFDQIAHITDYTAYVASNDTKFLDKIKNCLEKFDNNAMISLEARKETNHEIKAIDDHLDEKNQISQVDV